MTAKVTLAGNPVRYLGLRPIYLWSVLIAACAGAVILGCFSAVSNAFTDHRLMPLFLFRDRLPVYLEPNQGPMLSTLYPPLSVLFYAPATLFHSPKSVFFVAGFLAQTFSFLPLVAGLWLTRSRHPAARLNAMLVATGFIAWCNVSDVMGTAYIVHADAPALFLTASGILLYVAYTRSDRLFLLLLSAFSCALAPWAKQTAVPAVLIIPGILMLRKEIRLLVLYCLMLLGTEAMALAVVNSVLDIRTLFLWLITIPSRHPWRGVWSTILVEANRVLLYENAAALVVLVSTLLHRVRSHEGRLSGALRDIAGRPWAIFTLAGVLFWPTSMLGYVKVGGSVNTLLYATYCLDVGLALLVFELLNSENPATSSKMRLAGGTAVLLVFIPMATTIVKSGLRPGRFLQSSNQEAYEFSRRSPGLVYFPYHPLSVYLAEGKTYHFELGICDRVIAGITIDQSNFAAYLPARMKYVAYKGTVPSCTLELLPEFRRATPLPELPGWIVYARK